MCHAANASFHDFLFNASHNDRLLRIRTNEHRKNLQYFVSQTCILDPFDATGSPSQFVKDIKPMARDFPQERQQHLSNLQDFP